MTFTSQNDLYKSYYELIWVLTHFTVSLLMMFWNDININRTLLSYLKKKSMGLFAKILQKMSKCDKESGETLSCTSSATFFS